MPEFRRQWRDYQTPSGRRPVKEFLDDSRLPRSHKAEIVAAMKDVAVTGIRAARHLRGDIYEVRVAVETVGYRILFAEEGRFSQVLLSLEAFQKKTQKTPADRIQLAEQRLADWRSRANKTGVS